jgi:hypothetical protein
MSDCTAKERYTPGFYEDEPERSSISIGLIEKSGNLTNVLGQ